MTAPRQRLDITPRGLSRMQAAARIGVSVGTFARMVADGLMPPARAIYSLEIWDIEELDQAFDRLPHAGQNAPPSPRGSHAAPLPQSDLA
jgi:hypothetical protein